MSDRILEMVRGSNPIEIPILVLLLIMVASLNIDQGEAIHCFVCNSKIDPRCADPIQTDWPGSEEQDSDEESEDDGGGLRPVECHLAVKYSAGIQAVSDMLRGFGQPRLAVPNLWLSTATIVAPSSSSSGQGSGFGISGGSGGSYGTRGYGRGGNRGLGSWGYSYGGSREPEEMGCHKVDYTENGESFVDRGCAPSRIANMDACSALDLATNGGESGSSGSTGSSGSSGGFGGSGTFGSGSGGNSGSGFDVTQISAGFCEICTEDDGCNGAIRLANVHFLLILFLLLIVKLCFRVT